MSVVSKLIEKVTKKKVVVKKAEVEEVTCSNCDGSTQCSVCTPVFRDTFGE